MRQVSDRQLVEMVSGDWSRRFPVSMFRRVCVEKFFEFSECFGDVALKA